MDYFLMKSLIPNHSHKVKTLRLEPATSAPRSQDLNYMNMIPTDLYWTINHLADMFMIEQSN